MPNFDSPTLLCDEALRDPYPIYRRMREKGPVYHDHLADAWCILDFDLVRDVLQDSNGFSSHHLADRAEPVLGARVLAQMTGAEHDEKKAVTMRGIAATAMDGYYLPAVERVAKSLWEEIGTTRRTELVCDLASPFAIEVTSALLGIDAQWRRKILPWNRSVVEFITLLQQTPDERSRRLADAGYFRAFMLKLIESRRRSPRHDLVSYLAECGSSAGLTDDEIVALALNIFLAASEPLDKTLSYLVHETLRTPTLYEAVTSDSGNIPQMLTETMRLHPPVQIIPRITVGSQDIAGTKIPDGSTVYCMIGAANRDPSKFSDPDQFILARRENSVRKAFSPSADHLAFGSGLHFCIGAMLARRQLETAFQASLPYLAGWQLSKDALVEHGLYTRGPTELVLEKRK